MCWTPDKKTASSAGSPVTVRLAHDSDAGALARLAALDSSEAPEAPTLLAEVDGHAVAALPIRGGDAVADPFRRTAAMVQMLELRAAQLRGEGRSGAPARSRTARLWGLVRARRALPLR